MVGRTLGHYRILDQIGAGGMGVVYRAHDLTLPRDVAIKILAPGTLTDDAARHRFRKEADSLACITHPNVATVHEFGTDNGVDYLVTEYIPGVTLDTRIAGRPLPIKDVLGLGAQFAHGLAAAHDHGLVHRDLKPCNLRVTPEGWLKILDFGLAHLAAGGPDSLTVGTITDAGEVPGTLPYMSPEQLRGEPADVRSDIFSVGVVLYEMATGIRPFRGSTGPMTAHAILSAEPDPPHQHNHEITPGLENVILKALEKDPAHRYQSVRELGIDLERVSSGAPTLAKTWRLHWNWRWASVVAMLLLGLTTVLVSPTLRERAKGMITPEGPKHLAVLPFESSSISDQALAAGFAQSLTNSLSNLDPEQKSLWVVPFADVQEHDIHDPRMAWRELGAALVITGNVRREKDAIVLAAVVINAQHSRQVGSVELRDAAGDISLLQPKLTQRLAGVLRIQSSTRAPRTDEASAVPAAYESYLEALGLMQRYDKPGNLDKAIAALESALKRDPSFAVCYAALGEAYRMKYQVEHDPHWIEVAAAQSKQAIALSSDLPSAYVTLGRIHDSAGNYELAVEEFQHALKLHPRDPEAIYGLGRAYENAGRIADAEQTLVEAAKLRPDYWDSYNALALFYDRQRRYSEAITLINEAIKLTPDNSQLYSNLGAIYLDMGDPVQWRQAEQAFKQSIALNASYATYANLGFLYLQQKRCTEAAQFTEQAIGMNEHNYLEWENLALADQCLNLPLKASQAREREMALLEEEYRLNPHNAQYQSELSVLYARKGLDEKAIASAQASVTRAPDDASVLKNAAVAYELTQNRAQAIRLLTASLEKGTTISDLQQDLDLQQVLSDPRFSAPKRK